MQVITLYSINVWDGADRRNHKFYVETENAAKEYLKGNTYDNYHRVELVVYKDVEDIKTNSPDAIRAKALAKLTKEEKNILGIKD